MLSVSVIVPCFNHAETLARAVTSGLKQSHLEEIIIVDDQSTDGSLREGQRLANTDGRIRIVQTIVNMGPGGARNLGASLAKGSHICFLDADDELIDDFFGAVLLLLAAQPGMRVIKAEMAYFDPVKGSVLPSFDPRYRSIVLSSSCGMVMEREAFLALGGFSEDPVFRGPFGGEDVAFMQAVIAHYQPIGRLERPCYKVWSQAGSHLDKFLANTRIKGDSFEFVTLHADQQANGPLANAIDVYLANVDRRLGHVEEGGT